MQLTGLPKLLWILFKISFPLTLISYPLVAVFGSFSVWPPAKEALVMISKDKPILIGFSEMTSYTNTGTKHIATRTYVLFPSVLHNPVAITIKKTDESDPIVTESVTPVIFLSVYYIISIIGTWWFWLRPVNTQQGAPGDAEHPPIK